MAGLLNRAALLTLVICLAFAQGPPQPNSHNITRTNFLDHDTPITSFFGKTFLKQNIPYIDLPDSNIQNVYYYRWSVLQRHLRYTTPGTGYIITEFMQPVDYAGAFGTIDAAAGHQLEEAQWLRDTSYVQDYTQVWTRGPGISTQYTHWIMHAAATATNVTGDFGFFEAQLKGMARMWRQWDYVFDEAVGLYYFTPLWDAQEYSLPGYVFTNGTESELERTGPNTFRPSLNSYMVGNARAIALAAEMVGDAELAEEFEGYAGGIEEAMLKYLWDDEQEFFVDVIRPDNPDLAPIHGREEVGFYPFRFGIGLDSKYTQPTIDQLFDTDGFFTKCGPTTLEQRNKYYTPEPREPCCFWQGQSWPFSTAHTLKSLAAIYRSGTTNLTAEQYHQVLSIYATTQHKDGKPYVAESHFPDSDSWSADSFNHSEHYMHSANNDLVITGLLGLMPRADDVIEIDPIIPADWTFFALENVAYHDHVLTILYDESGDRYNQGAGLSIFADGIKVHNSKGPGSIARLPGNGAEQSDTSSPAPKPMDVNIAANPLGLGAWPKASATYTFWRDDPYKAIDGLVFYDSEPDNRWTNYDSPNSKDTLTIELPRPRNVSGGVLAVYQDSDRELAGGVACPKGIRIMDGKDEVVAEIEGFKGKCLENDKNVVAFGEEVETNTINIELTPQESFAVGVCEVEIWVPADAGPFYYAVDAHAVSDAHVELGTRSKATSNGAVLAPTSSKSEIQFSGVYSADGSVLDLSVKYRNSGSEEVVMRVSINQMAAGEVTLRRTQGSEYEDAVLKDVRLLKGTNFVTLYGGGDGVYIEGLRIS